MDASAEQTFILPLLAGQDADHLSATVPLAERPPPGADAGNHGDLIALHGEGLKPSPEIRTAPPSQTASAPP